MNKIRAMVTAIGASNLSLISLVGFFVLGACAMHFHLHIVVLAVAAIGTIGCFFTMLFQQRTNTQVERVNINESWDTMVKTIKDTHVLAMAKLNTCPDAALKEKVIVTLMEAASHMGSNPAWRNVHRITSGADIVRWYEAGTAKANEAKALIDGYVATNPFGGGL